MRHLTGNRKYIQPFVDITLKEHRTLHKVTENEKVIHYCFSCSEPEFLIETIQKVRTRVKEKGWKMDNAEARELVAPFYGPVAKTYFGITYNKAKDSISLSKFYTGYGYSQRKGIIYVVKKSEPLLCISKRLYAFKQIGRKYEPRIYTGRYHSYTLQPYLLRYLQCGEMILQLPVSYRHMWAETYVPEVVANYTGVSLNDISKVEGILTNYQMIELGKRGIKFVIFSREEGILVDNEIRENEFPFVSVNPYPHNIHGIKKFLSL